MQNAFARARARPKGQSRTRDDRVGGVHTRAGSEIL